MRERFLLDPDLVFLNHGSFGACPAEVLETCHRWQADMERNPVEFLARRSAGLLTEAREALGAYLGAPPAELVFVPNATHGVNLVARSLPLGEGDEILATDHEYGACDNAWDYVCRRSGARYVRVAVPLPFRSDTFVERIWAGVTPRTKVLYLSHITSTTALLFPIAELCRRARAAGILTLVDGAHTPGQLDLDLDALGADFYTGNLHKWLCAPKGSAFMHARAQHHPLLEALVVSWGYSGEVAGHTGFDAYTGTTLLERRHLWQGTRDLAPWLSVPSAIAFQERHDWRAVRQRCHAMAVETLHRVCALTGLEPPCRDEDLLQMAPIPVPPMEADVLKDTLFTRHRIEVPVTSHQGSLFVRISVQGYNTGQDLDALVAALCAIYRL